MSDRTTARWMKALTMVAAAGALTLTGCANDEDEGSPGAVATCSHCGVEKGAEGCCDPDAERCACGMIKGSEGCCADG